MNYEEALAELGLGPEPRLEDIHRAFRERAKAGGHPDHEGSNERFTRLTEAARVAADVVSRATAVGTDVAVRGDSGLVPVSPQSVELARLTREASLLRREESQLRIGEIVKVHLGRLQHLRRRNMWIGGVGAIVGATALLLRGIGGTRDVSNNTDTLIVAGATIAIAVGALFGVLAAVTNFQIQRLQYALEDVKSVLSRRPTYLRVLRAIVETDAHSPSLAVGLSSDELHNAIFFWMRSRRAHRPGPMSRISQLIVRHRSDRRFGGGHAVALDTLAARLGVEDFAEVLIAKGAETELLVEDETISDGELVTRYWLRVEPRRSAAPAEPDAEASAETARSE